MKQKILILGAGFAGMWAALGAARLAAMHKRSDIDITVMAPQPELRIRPRFYEDKVETLVSPLLPLFNATGIKFVQGEARRIDAGAKCVWFKNERSETLSERYDRLVLATGSSLRRDAVKGAAEYAFDVDSLETAARLEEHLNQLGQRQASIARDTLVVCGGGFTGIEMATELPHRLRQGLGEGGVPRVIVLERGSVIGGRWSAGLREAIRSASEELGIEWRLGVEISEVDGQGVVLSDGEIIPSQTVIWTAGVNASGLTQQLQAQRDPQGRLHVNPFLQVPGYEDIFASGDVARAATDDKGNIALMTCQHAIMLGRFVGHNAAASLLGERLLPYQQVNYVTCLDLGAWGAAYSEGWDQQVKFTRAEGKRIKQSINRELIYPPVADRQMAFKAADPLVPLV